MARTESTSPLSEPCPLCGRAIRIAARFGPPDARPDAMGLHGRSLCVCTQCGFGRLHPPYAVDAMRAHYETEYTAVRSGRAQLYQPYLKRLAGATRGRRLLDVGCGAGDFLAQAQTSGWDGIGVELRRGAAQAGATRGVRIFEGEVPAAEGVFDLITMWNVLDQMPDPMTETRSLLARLAPGGILFARVPNLRFHLWTWRLFNAIRPGRLSPAVIHPFGFTDRSLQMFLLHLGLQVESIEPSVWSGAGPMARLARWLVSLPFLPSLFGFRRLAPSLVAWGRRPQPTSP